MDPTWIDIGEPLEIEAAKHPDYPNGPQPTVLKQFSHNHPEKREQKTDSNNNKNTSFDRKTQNGTKKNGSHRNSSRDGKTIYDQNLSSTDKSQNPFCVLDEGE